MTDSTLIDGTRSAHLCDVGAPGFFVAMCVTADGSEEAWLVSESDLNVPGAPQGDPNQRHEQLGPLPDDWSAAVHSPYRCGHPRATDGLPCRQAVRQAGQTCAWHTPRGVS